MRLASDRPDVHIGTCLTGRVPRCYLVGAAALRRVAVRPRCCAACGVVHNPLGPLATGVPLVMSCLVSPDSWTCHRQLCMT